MRVFGGGRGSPFQRFDGAESGIFNSSGLFLMSRFPEMAGFLSSGGMDERLLEDGAPARN